MAEAGARSVISTGTGTGSAGGGGGSLGTASTSYGLLVTVSQTAGTAGGAGGASTTGASGGNPASPAFPSGNLFSSHKRPLQRTELLELAEQAMVRLLEQAVVEVLVVLAVWETSTRLKVNQLLQAGTVETETMVETG